MLAVTTSMMGSGWARAYPFLAIEGVGTVEHPLLLTALLRHADFADETASWRIGDLTREVGRSLVGALAILSGEHRSAPPPARKLHEVLIAGNTAARATGTYYSALVAVVSGSAIAAAGIGWSSLSLYREGEQRTVVASSTRTIPGAEPVLTAGLGLGWDPEQAHAGSLHLAAGETAILLVGTDPAADDGEPSSPDQFLTKQLAWAAAGDTTAIVALAREIAP